MVHNDVPRYGIIDNHHLGTGKQRCRAGGDEAEVAGTCAYKRHPRRVGRFVLAHNFSLSAWNAKICSSVDKSAWRKVTPFGTCKTVGAKLKIDRTPVATNSSQTCCALAAGTAIIPIETCSSPTMR